MKKQVIWCLVFGVMVLPHIAEADAADYIVNCKDDFSDRPFGFIGPDLNYKMKGKRVRDDGIDWRCLARKGLQIRMKQGADPVLFDFAKPIDLYRYFEPLKGSSQSFSSVASQSLSASDLTISGTSHFSNTLEIQDGSVRVLRTADIDFADNRLQHVGEAIELSDGVNLGQLKHSLNQLEDAFHRSLDGLRQSLQDYTTQEAHFSGLATSMAMAALPHASLPGDRVISLGSGTYGGKIAFAAGASFVSESGHWIYKASLGVGSTIGANAGVAYAW